MPGSIKRKSQRAGGGCSWRNGGGKKSSIRKLKMRGGGSGHLHKKGGNRNSMRGGGGCGYNPQRGRRRSMRGGGSCGNHPKGRGRSMRGGGGGHLHKKGGNRNSMRGGGSCGNHPKGRGRSMRGGGYGGSSNGSNWGTINKSRNMRKLSRKQIRMKRKRVIVDEEKFRKRR